MWPWSYRGFSSGGSVDEMQLQVLSIRCPKLVKVEGRLSNVTFLLVVTKARVRY